MPVIQRDRGEAGLLGGSRAQSWLRLTHRLKANPLLHPGPLSDLEHPWLVLFTDWTRATMESASTYVTSAPDAGFIISFWYQQTTPLRRLGLVKRYEASACQRATS